MSGDPELIRRGREISHSRTVSVMHSVVQPWPDDDPGPPEPPVEEPSRAATEAVASVRVLDGAQFVLDQPPDTAAIWGDGARVLWAPGEALMIAGPQGTGKTTLAGQLIRALLGCAPTDVLGLPVVNADRRRVLYLAMDRPRQIRRSLGRQFTEADRDALAAGLIVRPGPPATDLAAQPTLLVGMAAEYGAGIIVVDSLKDAAVGLSKDEVAAGYNRARQYALAAGIDILELHHTRKATGDPTSMADTIYGSTWLTSGVGSIVLLSGDPGDPIVGFRHLKQPAEEVGPYRLLHDQPDGVLTVEHAVDIVEQVKAAGVDGLTTKGAAAAITEKQRPSRADVEKARRRLEYLVREGRLVRIDPGDKPGATTAYFLAAEGVSRGVTV